MLSTAGVSWLVLAFGADTGELDRLVEVFADGFFVALFLNSCIEVPIIGTNEARRTRFTKAGHRGATVPILLLELLQRPPAALTCSMAEQGFVEATTLIFKAGPGPWNCRFSDTDPSKIVKTAWVAPPHVDANAGDSIPSTVSACAPVQVAF